MVGARYLGMSRIRASLTHTYAHAYKRKRN